MNLSCNVRMCTELGTEPLWSSGIEVAALAMANHADHIGIQAKAVGAIQNMVWDIPEHIAIAKAVGVVPLLQRAGENTNERSNNTAAAKGRRKMATEQLKRMGACPGYRKGLFTSKCKCGEVKDNHGHLSMGMF